MTRTPSISLKEALWAFMREVPVDMADSLCAMLCKVPAGQLSSLTPLSLGPVPYLRSADLLCAAVRACAQEGLAKDPERLAQWLTCLSANADTGLARESTELVWTGPLPEGSIPRRTDQALEELICAATQEILLVSFAVYKVAHISASLREAATRLIRIRVVLEDQKATAPVVKVMQEFSGVPGIKFYVWPESKRPTGANGYKGAMHDKCALADDHHLFLSSANLTEHALNINMEMGVLIRGGDLPRAAGRHFNALIADGVLELIHVSE